MISPSTYIHDTDAFASILQLERSRSDRSGNPFALILFTFTDLEHRNGFLAQLRESVRATDHVGIMNDKAAVILWHTATQGACRFVDKLASEPAGWAYSQEVYVYPGPSAVMRVPDTFDHSLGDHCLGTSEFENEPPDSFQHDDSDFDDAGHGVQTMPTVKRRSTTDTRIEQTIELTETLVRDLIEETSTATSQRVETMDAFFVKPMPVWKRTLDVFGASVGLVVLSPLFAVVAVLIKLTSPGPVIFSQLRSGRGGRPFTMLKFRSMGVDAEQKKKELLKNNEQDGPAFKMESDPRITSIGHVIRKTSIDELPQLWNVLKGDMSIVGPRPLPCDETSACESWQKRRLEVTPGLTCIWQVQDRRTKIPFAEWARMDIRYIRSRTPRHDLSLVMRTIKSILGRKGS